MTAHFKNPLAADLDFVLDRTRGLWDELRGVRIFITGGTGFFGCWLLESFVWANRRLALNAAASVLTRDPDRFRGKAPHLASAPEVTLHPGDVRSFAFPSGGFSHVIHAATDSSRACIDETPLEMFDTVVQGTRRTLDFAVQAGASKLLLTSSGAVYGRQPHSLSHVPETFSGGPEPADPGNCYAEGKRAAELLCSMYARPNFQPKIARCFAFVGPYLPLDIHFAIGNFISDALAGFQIRVKGDGTPLRSYLYAADLAIWLWTILFRGAPNRPYNVGSEDARSIAEIASVVAQVFGRGPEAVSIACAPVHGKPAERYIPSTERCRTELGLTASVRLEDAVLRTREWAAGAGRLESLRGARL